MLVLRAPDFQNVQANGTASVEFPLGRTYEKINLQLGGTALTKAMLTDIQLKLNGKLFWRTTGSRLDLMNQYRNITANAALITLDFTERDAKTIEAMKFGAFAATREAGIQRFTAEVTIAGATAPTLTGWCQVDEPSANPIIVTMKQSQFVLSGAVSLYPIYVPFGSSGGLLKRVWIFHSGNVTNVEVKKDNVGVFENIPTAVNQFIQNENQRVQQTNVWVYDPAMDKLQSNVLNTRVRADGKAPVESFDVRVTTSAADTLNVVTEMYELNSRI
jgi:hypothetical protein